MSQLDSARLRAPQSLKRGGQTADAISLSLVGNDPGTSLASLSPSDFQGFRQPLPIIGIVQGPVRSISVVGDGAISCSGTFGVLVGYSADDVELGRTNLSLIDPSDCSTVDNPDNVTFGAQGTLTVASGMIARFEILPMSLLEFPVFELVGRASATYAITLGSSVAPELRVVCSPAEPVRGTLVECVATANDGSTFTLTRLKSTSGGVTILEGAVTQPSSSSATWRGAAAVATEVTFSGLVGTTPVTGTGSFGIKSRIGTAGWIEPDAPSFPAAPPAPIFVREAPLKSTYPGIFANQPNQGGYSVAEGALGFTFVNFPVTALPGMIPAGPNQGVKLLVTVRWQADPASGGTTPAIYVRESLQPTDAFFKRQTGPRPLCTQADMSALRSLILSHEARHWTEAHGAMVPLHTQSEFERLTELPGQSSLAAEFERIRSAYAGAITLANNNVETTLLPVAPNAPVCDMRN